MTEFQVVGFHYGNKVEMNLAFKSIIEVFNYMRIFYPSVEIQNVYDLGACL